MWYAPDFFVVDVPQVMEIRKVDVPQVTDPRLLNR